MTGARLRVFVSGQKAFGAAAAQTVLDAGHQVVAVAAPAYAGPDAGIPWAFGDDDTMRHDRLRTWAGLHEVTWHEACTLTEHHIPACDVILAAHSQAFVGRRSRAKARLAAVGYHPSLLPLHRGRDAVRWTIRDGDRVTGGSVYHLTADIDAGPLAAQDYLLVPPGSTAATLWRDLLAPLGLTLIRRVLGDLADGRVVAVPQQHACATWEPSWERPRLHRPELPELTGPDGALRYDADPAALRGHPDPRVTPAPL